MTRDPVEWSLDWIPIFIGMTHIILSSQDANAPAFFLMECDERKKVKLRVMATRQQKPRKRAQRRVETLRNLREVIVANLAGV